MRIRQIFLRGLPGAGKSTFGRLLESRLSDSQYISSGQLLRQAAKTDRNLNRVLSQGELVDSSIIMNVMISQLVKHPSPVIILDGFPRKLTEMKGWISKTTVPSLVVYLELPTAAIVQRLLHRTVCSICGINYNSYSDSETSAVSPHVSNTCDRCGTPLTQRPEDTEAIIMERLKTSLDQEKEITKYLEELIGKNKILHVNSLAKNEAVEDILKSFLNE